MNDYMDKICDLRDDHDSDRRVTQEMVVRGYWKSMTATNPEVMHNHKA